MPTDRRIGSPRQSNSGGGGSVSGWGCREGMLNREKIGKRVLANNQQDDCVLGSSREGCVGRICFDIAMHNADVPFNQIFTDLP